MDNTPASLQPEIAAKNRNAVAPYEFSATCDAWVIHLEFWI